MAYSHDTSYFINDYRGLMLLYFYREIYNVYNGNTQLCDIHYFILKGDKKMAKEFIDFKEKYDGMMEWTIKKIGYVLQNQDDLDLDELYGMATVALKKAMDLSNAAMDLVEYQTEVLDTISKRSAIIEEQNERLWTLVNRLDGKLDKIEEKVKLNLNSVYGTKEKKEK